MQKFKQSSIVFGKPGILSEKLKLERYLVSLRIQYEYGKNQTRITPNTDSFHLYLLTFLYWMFFFSFPCGYR